MQDFENEKIKEMKENTPIFIVGRNNSLFESYIPKIVNYLAEMGRQVETKIFPQGTDEKKIEEWYKDNAQAMLTGKAIISDQTASVPYELSKEMRNEINGSRSVGNIDNLIRKVFNEILIGNSEMRFNIFEGADPEKIKTFMINTIQHILSNPQNNPEKIIIFKNKMGHHTNEIVDVKKDQYKHLDTHAASTISKEAGNQAGIDAGNYVVAQIKEWLENGGFAIEKIQEKAEGNNEYRDGVSKYSKIFEESDLPNAWIIIDRHNDIKPGDAKSAIVLGMPASNFYHDAMENNLINFSDEEIEKTLKDVLKKEFVS